MCLPCRTSQSVLGALWRQLAAVMSDNAKAAEVLAVLPPQEALIMRAVRQQAMLQLL